MTYASRTSWVSICAFGILFFDPFGDLLSLKLPAVIALALITFFRLSRGAKFSFLLPPYICLVFTLLAIHTVLLLTTGKEIPLMFGFFLNNFFLFSLFLIYGSATGKSAIDELAVASIPVIFCTFLLNVIQFFNTNLLLEVRQLAEPFGILSIQQRDFGIVFISAYHNSIFYALAVLPVLLLKIKLSSSRQVSYKTLKTCVLLSLCLPIIRSIIVGLVFIWWIYRRSVFFKISLVPSLCLIFVGCLLLFPELLFDHGSAIKQASLRDYQRIFNDTQIIFLGQGLGAETYWGEPRNEFNWITELTLLEWFRYFGLVVGLPLLALMIVPLLFFSGDAVIQAFRIGILAFLIASLFNPLIWGVIGMSVWGVGVSMIFKGSTVSLNEERK